MASFHGVFTPDSSSQFPLAALVYLEQDGTGINGAATRHIFQSAGETANLAMSTPIAVTTTPSTIEVVPQITGETGSLLYSDVALTIQRIADLPN